MTLPPGFVQFGGEYCDGQAVSRLVEILEDLRHRTSSVTLLLHGQGGNSAAGDALHSILASYPAPITGHAVGNIASAMLAVLLGCAERYATPTASISYHGTVFNPRAWAESGKRVRRVDLAEALDTVRSYDETRVAQFLTRTMMTETEARALVESLTTPPLEWSVSKGVLHGIRPADIPLEAIVVSAATSPVPPVKPSTPAKVAA